jgi:menaquinone-9 beta-reductase
MSTLAPMRFDALVIGAGPAGAATAIQLARAGWSVGIVERQNFPRRKVCGECLAASNLPLLDALGIGAAFDVQAGPALRWVSLMTAHAAVRAALPPARHGHSPWGRALGRETLDGLLLDEARSAGATVLQPWAVHAIDGGPGDWRLEVRSLDGAAPANLAARLLVDAHGSWHALPSDRPRQRGERRASDLLAFKANFSGSALPTGHIGVLALDGAYGGMVVADQGISTLACCIRRDRLSTLRREAPGRAAGEVVEAFLRRSCAGVRQALAGAVREGPWLAAGPLDTGVRVHPAEPIFRVGNAAGEAHPLLGEGMSMALQSAALLCRHLLQAAAPVEVPDAAHQADIQRRYAAAWRQAFVPRMRVAAAFAHLAMRPAGAAALLGLARLWPGLLTQGARWGGKVRTVQATPQP